MERSERAIQPGDVLYVITPPPPFKGRARLVLVEAIHDDQLLVSFGSRSLMFWVSRDQVVESAFIHSSSTIEHER